MLHVRVEDFFTQFDSLPTLSIPSLITHEDEWHLPCVQIEASASARVDYTDDGLEVLLSLSDGGDASLKGRQ